MALPHSASGAKLQTDRSSYGVILRLAMPTVVAMLLQSAVNEVDIIFLSRLGCPESSNAQAALLPSFILLWMFGGSLSAISVGTQAIAARRFAEGKYHESGSILANSWFFSLVAGIVFTAIGYLILPYILGFMIRVPEVREAANEYLKWRLLGIASMAMTFSLKSFFDGIGKTHVHMVSSIVMNALNVFLCVVLIFGYWGAPRMGIAGAGLAGFISTWVGLALMVGWVTLPAYRERFKPFNVKALSRSTTWAILRLSIPSAVATVAVMTGFMMFSMIVSYLDSVSHASLISTDCPGGRAEAVNSAATAVIVGILKLTFTACLAFGTSTATLVSQSLGEMNPVKAERFGWASVKLGLVLFGAVGLCEGLLFTRPMLAFVTQSPAVLEAALVPLRMMGFATPLIATGMILTQALFGAGNSRFVMIVELLLHFLCLVPLAWLLGLTFHLGIVGIWLAALAYVILLSGVMVWKFKSGDWKGIRI